jgi:hypothetical protein
MPLGSYLHNYHVKPFDVKWKVAVAEQKSEITCLYCCYGKNYCSLISLYGLMSKSSLRDLQIKLKKNKYFLSAAVIDLCRSNLLTVIGFGLTYMDT